MYTLLVTGGIGSGKSVVGRCLAAKGALRVDLDEVARAVRESGEATPELTARFGMEILDENLQVNPARLAAAAFSSDENTQALNEIMLPRILQWTLRILGDDECVPCSKVNLRVIEIPLLEEGSPYLDLCDEVMAVCVPTEVRVERAVARGMDEEDARRRIAQQVSDDARVALADTVLVNEGSVEEFVAKIDSWWAQHESTGWKSMRL